MWSWLGNWKIPGPHESELGKDWVGKENMCEYNKHDWRNLRKQRGNTSFFHLTSLRPLTLASLFPCSQPFLADSKKLFSTFFSLHNL
eukprot:g31508.t1